MGGENWGQVAAQLVDQALSLLPQDVTAREAVDMITASIRDFYKKHNALELVQEDPSQRVTAALVVISFWRKEIWFVGDCQCMLDNYLIQHTKLVDDITTQARAMFLEAELQKGKTLEELRRNDTGRAFIFPLLKQQQHFQNNPSAGAYWYPAIDGFPVPDEGIQIELIPQKTRTVILASDGYPDLKDTLAGSEQALQRILEEDPLLFRFYKSTKGVQDGAISYDDRAYIRLRLTDASAVAGRNEAAQSTKGGRKKKKSSERK